MVKISPKPKKIGFILLGIIGLLPASSVLAWERIITLNPVIAEWAAELLGKEKTLKTVIGVSEYSHFPEFMKKIESIGPYPNIQIEKILELKPDLVIASDEYNRRDQIEKLKSLNVNVQVLPSESFHKMDNWIIQLGKILNVSDAAKSKAQFWNQSVAELEKPKTKKSAFFEVQFHPLITVGKKSFINDAFMLIGYENVFKDLDQSYPKVAVEAVLKKKPDTVFVFEMVKDKDVLEKNRNYWKNSKVVLIVGDDFSRCSPRLLKALKGIK